MVEFVFPKCPHCREEVLIPLSACYRESTKTFAHWVCLKCGFYFGTAGTGAYNIPKDFTVGVIPEISKIIEDIKKRKLDRAWLVNVEQFQKHAKSR